MATKINQDCVSVFRQHLELKKPDTKQEGIGFIKYQFDRLFVTSYDNGTVLSQGVFCSKLPKEDLDAIIITMTSKT